MEQIVLRVEGMSCGACEERLGKALSKREGVVSAKADHQQAHVRVVYDPATVTTDALRGWILGLGFEAPV